MQAVKTKNYLWLVTPLYSIRRDEPEYPKWVADNTKVFSSEAEAKDYLNNVAIKTGDLYSIVKVLVKSY